MLLVKMKSEKKLAVLIVLISISSVLAWCKVPIGNTTIWWGIDAFVLIFLNKLRNQCSFNIKVVNLFLILVLCSAVYGVIEQAQIYWDYKLLCDNLMIFLLPLAAYAYMEPSVLKTTLKSYLKFSPWLLLFLAPFLYSDAYGRFLVPYSFMALFFNELDRKNKILVTAAFLITIIFGSESRSDVIKFTICVCMAICFYYKKISRGLLKIIGLVRYVFLVIPFVFFVLGATGVFNIFNVDEELGFNGKYSMKAEDVEEDVSALVDTRTFLYVEEINSAIKNNYVIFGNSIARGYDSAFFGHSIDLDLKTNRGERQSCEVSILNVFNYFGLVGCIIYFLIFSTASYYAICKSKNRFVPIIGLYVAFRWTFAWIEDFSKFDLNYLFLWIMIGICFSPLYRNMTDEDFKLWVKSID